MYVAVNAIGEHYLGEQRAAMAAFTLGLLLTFLAVRINTRLIRAKVSWWFHDIESEGGVHVHHMVIGVVLMVVMGITLIGFTPAHLWLQLCALVFGAGVALTLDEFALILRLQDVYWRAEGRLSVDAVIVAVCAGLFFILGVRPGGIDPGAAAQGGVWVEVTLAFTVFFNMCWAVVCLFKGKYWTGFFGVFVPIVAVVGALRLARPNSPWARKRYADKPKKLARAERREDRTDRTWRAWREAFFDLIAGKPHLPSIPPYQPPDPPAVEDAASDEAGELDDGAAGGGQAPGPAVGVPAGPARPAIPDRAAAAAGPAQDAADPPS